MLVYGLEVVLPKPALMKKLSKLYKKMLKQILSLPSTVADSAVFILSGAFPIKGVIHNRALILFGNVCRLEEDSVDKQLDRRLLAVKSFSSCSCYVEIRKILIRYDAFCVCAVWRPLKVSPYIHLMMLLFQVPEFALYNHLLYNCDYLAWGRES